MSPEMLLGIATGLLAISAACCIMVLLVLRSLRQPRSCAPSARALIETIDRLDRLVNEMKAQSRQPLGSPPPTDRFR